MTKKLIYIPSFDSGIASYAAKKDFKLNNGIPWKFWAEDFPEQYRHPYFLITAGHSYKKKNYKEKFNFPPDMNIFGDSGGYQIVTGKLKWEEKLRHQIFEWLEENSTIAINLDLPPRGTGTSDFHRCLDISKSNFQYFCDKQTGKVDFLNVIHGTGYDTYKLWYNTVKQYQFQGWSIGGATGKLISLIESLIVLLEGREHLNPTNKWLHVLGASSIIEFLILAQIQKSFNDIGSVMTLTTDSSTPSRSTTYGYYYTSYDLKTMKFQYVKIPRHRKESADDIIPFKSHVPGLPKVTIFDHYIWNQFDINDFVEFKTEHYVWLILHNYAIFYDACESCNLVVQNDKEIRNQYLSTPMSFLLDCVDEIIKSESPLMMYNKYKHLFVNMARMISDIDIKTNSTDFF